MRLATFRPWSEFHAEYMKNLDLDDEYDDDDFGDDEEEEFIDFSPEGIARMYERGDLGDLDEPEYEPQKSSIDPIRKEVVASIKQCRSAGIKVLMITGDHP